MRFRYHSGQKRASRTQHYTVPWRRLPCTLIEMCGGTGGWTLELERGQRHAVRAGEVLVIRAETRHRMQRYGTGRMFATWVLASWEWLVGLDAVGCAAVPTVLPRSTGRTVAPLLDGLLDVADAASTGSLQAICRQQTLGFRLLEEIGRHGATPVLASPSAAMERVRPVLRFVAENIVQPMNRTDLAQQMHLSPTRFHAVFRAAMGTAPMAYVQKARLQKARELLVSTDLPIYGVAERCGFQSVYYFCRAFKKELRTTPTAYRRAAVHP